MPQKLIANRDFNLVVQTGPSLVFYGMFMNYARAPLNDVRIRQALNYAIDRDEINKVLNAGLGEPTCCILPKEHWATDPGTFNYYKHDPDKARALLKEAGHDGGIDLPCFGWADQVAMQSPRIADLPTRQERHPPQVDADHAAAGDAEFHAREEG